MERESEAVEVLYRTYTVLLGQWDMDNKQTSWEKSDVCGLWFMNKNIAKSIMDRQ